MKYFYSAGAVLAVGAAVFAWLGVGRPALEVVVWLVLAGVLAVAAEVAELGEKVAARGDPVAKSAACVDPLTGQRTP